MLTRIQLFRIWVWVMLLDLGLFLLNLACFLFLPTVLKWVNFGAMIFIAVLFGFACGMVWSGSKS